MRRDWRKPLVELKRQLGLGDAALAKRIGIPRSTLKNLVTLVVHEPLHSNGEKILALYRVTFPGKS